MNRCSHAENSNENSRKAAFIAAFVVLVLAAYLISGVLFSFYIPCPFRLITGFKCPGCGLSHAATDFVRLDFRAAFRHNALFLPIYLYIVYAAIRSFLYSTGKKDPLTDKTGKRIDIVFLVVILVWWFVRNIFTL